MVSPFYSTLMGYVVGVDSKRVCRRFGGDSCGRSEGSRGRDLGQVAEWKAGSAMGCRVELLAPMERIGLLGWD